MTTDESYWTNAGWGIFMRIQAVPWNGQIVVSIYTFCMVRTPSQPAALHEFLLLRGEWVKKRVLIYVLFFSLRIFTLEYFLPKKLFSCFCFFPFFPFSLFPFFSDRRSVTGDDPSVLSSSHSSFTPQIRDSLPLPVLPFSLVRPGFRILR